MLKINFFRLQSQAYTVLKSLTRSELKDLLQVQRLKERERSCSLVTLITACLMHQHLALDLKLFHVVFQALAKSQSWSEKSASGQKVILTLPSYPRWVYWYNRLGPVLERGTQVLLAQRREKRKFQPVTTMVDSTLLPVNSGKGYTKSLRRQASMGHSSCGKAFGFKLHMIADVHGRPLGAHLSTAKVHDHEGLRILAQQSDLTPGILLADRGYLSKATYFSLMEKGVTLAARPKENMENGNDAFWFEYSTQIWPRQYKPLYAKRQNIEHEFGFLKHRLNLCVRGARCLGHVLTKVYSALLVRLTMCST